MYTRREDLMYIRREHLCTQGGRFDVNKERDLMYTEIDLMYTRR